MAWSNRLDVRFASHNPAFADARQAYVGIAVDVPRSGMVLHAKKPGARPGFPLVLPGRCDQRSATGCALAPAA
jgi:hypothetical protein